jgi:hypothetical protein
MTDKEQALVAAAYRAAGEKCEAISDEYRENEGRRFPELRTLADQGASDCAEAVISLTPTDAEAKLRELMVKVAEKVSNIPRGKTYSIEDIVDEVLNGHQ